MHLGLNLDGVLELWCGGGVKRLVLSVAYYWIVLWWWI